MGMNEREYELLDYLATNKGNGEDIRIASFNMDVIKSLMAQKLIRTNLNKSEGRITGLGIVTYKTEQHKRKRATDEDTTSNQQLLADAADDPEGAENVGAAGTVDSGTHPVELNRKHFAILEKLRDLNADGQGVKFEMHWNLRRTLELHELIKTDRMGRTWLLAAGRDKLEEWLSKVANAEASDNGTSMEDSQPLPLTPSPSTLARSSHSYSEGEHQPESCEGDCPECVNLKVLNIIAQKYPNVARLRDVLLEQERLLRELGL